MWPPHGWWGVDRCRKAGEVSSGIRLGPVTVTLSPAQPGLGNNTLLFTDTNYGIECTITIYFNRSSSFTPCLKMAEEAKCPDVLRKVLDLANNIEKGEESLYCKFLCEADRSVNAKELGTLDVTLSSRLTDADAGAQSEGVNSSLVLIFSFYAKLQNPSTQMQKGGLTYDEIKLANETLSFYELLLLLRDFNVLPKLITKDELLFLWKVGNIQRISNGKGSLRMLDIQEFVDMLAKIAVFAYNKPGLRQMVISLNGEMITPLEQVQSLIAYLHLEDYERVRNIVRTVGVQTAGLLHNRSEGEQNYRTIQHLKDDLRGARVAKYLSRQGSKKTAPGPPVPVVGNDEIDESDPLAIRIGTELRRNMFGVDDYPSVQSSYDEKSEDNFPSGDKRERSRVEDIMRSINESESAYLSSAMGQVYHKAENKKPQPHQSPDKLPISGLYVPRVHISETQERALVQYHPSLTKELLRYAVESTFSGIKLLEKKTSIPDDIAVFEPSGAAFVDIGIIVPGKECNIRVVVINRGSHEANIQISTKGFVADELTVIKMPRAIAPGLRQVVIVKFLPPKDFVGGCLCTISISSVTNPSNMIFQQESTVHCPVYYNVSSKAVGKSDMPESSSKCTLRSLPSLLALNRVSSGTKSTDELGLFNRTTKSNRPASSLNSLRSTVHSNMNSNGSKTRRLSMAHSLR